MRISFHSNWILIFFLGLPPQQHFIDTYIATHTGEVRENVTDHAKIPKADDGAYGTKRKSSEATAFKWAETMAKDKEWLNHIEDTCQEPMQTLGYARYHKGATHGDILVKNFEEVWPYQWKVFQFYEGGDQFHTYHHCNSYQFFVTIKYSFRI